MNGPLSLERLLTLIDQTTRVVTEKTSGILLNQKDVPMPGEILLEQKGISPEKDNICTVYTRFERNMHFVLAMYAQTELFERLTKRMMCSEHVSFQDVEDFSKEFFNVLCGHIAAAMFRDAKVAVRFQIPEFYRGWYQPDEPEDMKELQYLSDAQENAWLVHYRAPA